MEEQARTWILWKRASRWKCSTRASSPSAGSSPALTTAPGRTPTMIATRSMAGPGRSHPPAEPYGPLHPRPIGKLGGERLAPVSAQVQSFSDDVDAKIGDPVRRLEATLNLSPAGAARSASLPVAVDVPRGGSARITFDMGGSSWARCSSSWSAPAGTVLDLSYTEDPLAPPEGRFRRDAFRHALHRPGRERPLQGVRRAWFPLRQPAGPRRGWAR